MNIYISQITIWHWIYVLKCGQWQITLILHANKTKKITWITWKYAIVLIAIQVDITEIVIIKLRTKTQLITIESNNHFCLNAFNGNF